MEATYSRIQSLFSILLNESHSSENTVDFAREIFSSACQSVDLKSWAVSCCVEPTDIRLIQKLVKKNLETRNYALVETLAALLALLKRGRPTIESGKYSIPNAPAFPPTSFITKAKIEHDLEQLRYLHDRGLITTEVEEYIPNFEEALRRLSQPGAPAKAEPNQFPFSKLGSVNNHILSHRVTPRVERTFSESWNPRATEKEYFDGGRGVIVIDNFLSENALNELRLFCLESTVWFGNRYLHDRLSTSLGDGFCSPLILQIVEDLEQLMPNLFRRNLPLRELWAFKSGPEIPADVTNHADDAAVNVNFWITDDNANLDKRTGGLKIFDITAPDSWGFDLYNGNQDKIKRYLSENNSREAVIPYKSNRAVIFNSNFFHAIDKVTFRPGYSNKRINITMLFGDRLGEGHRQEDQ